MNIWIPCLLAFALASGVPGCGQEPQPAQKPATCPASFLDAIQSGAADAIETHLSLGCDVNAVLELEKTPLHWAAELGNANVAKVLIDKGADVNAKAAVGVTPLHLAVGEWGRFQLFHFLYSTPVNRNKSKS